MIDLTALRLLHVLLDAWLAQREADAVRYLIAENRTLRSQLGHHPLRLPDAQRRRLAILGHRLGRARLRTVAPLSRRIRSFGGIASWSRQTVGITTAFAAA